MNHKYKLVWLSDELEGYECINCGYQTVDPEEIGICVIYTCPECGWKGVEPVLFPGYGPDYDEFDVCPVCWENDVVPILVDIEYIQNDELHSL